MKKIVIAGGTGFLGRTLINWHIKLGNQIVVLSRKQRAIRGAKVVLWDGKTLEDNWRRELDDATAVINLAGRSVNCRYTKSNRRAIWSSRIRSTHVLGKAIHQSLRPPKVWLNSSTATIYKHTYDAANDEINGIVGATPAAKDDFSVRVAQAWENEFNAADTPHTRKITLRTAMVFGNESGGVYETLRKLTSLGLGGKMAHGKQYVSWIHADDFCRSLDWLINSPDSTGIYNICSPCPIPNREMMQNMRSVLKTPFGLPATRGMLEIGTFLMRTETELIIKSRRVIPERILAEGFTFDHINLKNALEDLENSVVKRNNMFVKQRRKRTLKKQNVEII
ncbi:MAG: TIGR01777 family oxidoreductase [Calditrichia bacterium]